MNDSHSETAFAVDGMFCGGCAATVERALKRLPGVSAVSVSYLSNCAYVTHDISQVDRGALVERLDKLGYEARTLDDAQADVAQSKFQRSHQIRLAIAVGFGLWVMMAGMARYLTDLPTPRFEWWVAIISGLFSLPVLLYSGLPFFRLGWRGLLARAPGMESLILIATVAAVAGSLFEIAKGGSHVWFEVPVMLIIFQLVARLTDFGARRRAADAIRSMLDLSPERARLVKPDQVTDVDASTLMVDDVIESRAGERIAGDGVIINGEAMIDTSLLTGESLPSSVSSGAEVLAGTLNTDGTVQVKITAAGKDRALDQLAATVGGALSRKSDLMRLTDRVASWLVPTISIGAAIAFCLAFVQGHDGAEALSRALAVLVVSCPCALSLAVPLVISTTAASGAKNGIILRDPASIEHAAKIDTVLLDKTGTLTEAKLVVTNIEGSNDYNEEAVLQLAAWISIGSNHPLSKAIVRHAELENNASVETAITNIKADSRLEKAGYGLKAITNEGATIVSGSYKWLVENEVSNIPLPSNTNRSRVFLARNKQYVGLIELADTLRPDAFDLLLTIKKAGMTPILASGDTEGCVKELAEQLDLKWHAELTPEDKRVLIEQLQAQGRNVAFVGDGLNDALALAEAEVGIATVNASDLAKSAASISLMQDGLNKVNDTLKLLRLSSKVLRQNLVWAVIYNGVLLPAAVLGFVHPVMAAIAMMLSASSVSFNSLRVVAQGS